MAAYETTVQLTQFAGVYQDGEGMNLNLKYATDAINCDTTGGCLRPMRKGTKIQGDLPSPIGTLMHLYQRFWPIESERDILVAACGTKLYYRYMTATTWTQVSGVTITNDDFDYITYESTRLGNNTPTDILLMSNADDGMLCFWGDDFSVTTVSTPHKFGIIARHMERIWGSGVKDEPDLLVYSAPYDPFDWEQDDENPEDGAGEIRQPSWDGDSFVALRNYGSYLLAFKKERVWRVLGTNPGEYILREQLGGGAVVENTVVVDGGTAFMLGFNGIMAYDGTEVYTFADRNIKRILDRINPATRDKATAIIKDNVYLLALPLDNATDNNAILEYNIREKTYNLRYGVSVRTFLRIQDKVYYTSAASPYSVILLDGGSALPVRWVSGFQDLQAKNITKSGFIVYLSVEAPEPMALDVTIETEKKKKVKTYYVRPGGKVKRLMFGLMGKRFRIILESNTDIQWYIAGGVQISCELDED